MRREDDTARWQSLLDLQTRAREYVAVLGLELILETEGFAYLRQRATSQSECEGELGYLNHCRHVLHDRDKKFCTRFAALTAAAAKPVRFKNAVACLRQLARP